MDISLPINSKLKENYTIKAVLGYGGFGITYLAEFLSPEKKVAIKELFLKGCLRQEDQTVILTQHINTKEYELAKRKFTEEAIAISKLNHKGIVEIRDVFEANNTSYYVMEFIDPPRKLDSKTPNSNPTKAMTLRDYTEKKEALDEEEVLYFGLQLAQALKAVHTAGILHLDIKPDNIMVSREIISIKNSVVREQEQYRLVLIDFGTSKMADNEKTILSRFAFYSKYFSAPELLYGINQIEQNSKSGDKRIEPYIKLDTYSLGATIYYAITGHNPHEQFTGKELISPDHFNSKISKESSEFTQKAMSFKPEDRFQDMAEIIEAIEDIILHLQKDKKQSPERDDPKTIHIPQASEIDSKVKAPENKYKRPIIAGLTILAVLLVFSIFSFLKPYPIQQELFVSGKEKDKIMQLINNNQFSEALNELKVLHESYGSGKNWIKQRMEFCRYLLNYNKELSRKNCEEARKAIKAAKEMNIPSNVDFKSKILDTITDCI